MHPEFLKRLRETQQQTDTRRDPTAQLQDEMAIVDATVDGLTATVAKLTAMGAHPTDAYVLLGHSIFGKLAEMDRQAAIACLSLLTVKTANDEPLPPALAEAQQEAMLNLQMAHDIARGCPHGGAA